jgi:energy-coupling factor transport system substrate-specific component
MITSFVLSAGLYAVLLYVFSLAPIWIIPGVTSIRPGNAIPPVVSLLFGPAGAWGSAFGNLIGFDILGGALTIGSIGGFVGNFFLGYVPYKVWSRLFKEEPHCRTLSSLAKFETIVLIHAGTVSLIIPLWTELVGFVPFTPLAFIIFWNEVISALILGPILQALLYGRVKRAGWLWADVMKGYQYTPKEVKSQHRIGAALVAIGGIVGVWVTIAVGLGLAHTMNPMGLFGQFGGMTVLATGGVFLLVWLIGIILLQ